MAKKRKKSRKIKKMKADISSLEERARDNALVEEDCEFIASMVETIEFIRNNLDKDEEKLKQLIKENLNAKPEKFLKTLLGAKAEEIKRKMENPTSCSEANDTNPKKNVPLKN